MQDRTRDGGYFSQIPRLTNQHRPFIIVVIARARVCCTYLYIHIYINIHMVVLARESIGSWVGAPS